MLKGANSAFLLPHGPIMQIGQLASRAGVSIDTVRYYERAGVLPNPQRRASGYRVYAPGDIERLNFIKRAKDMGFSLDEIRQLLGLASADSDMSLVKATAKARLDDVEHRIRELERMRDGLKQLVDACPGQGDVRACPILGNLSGTGKR